jgi:hypothetical protein
MLLLLLLTMSVLGRGLGLAAAQSSGSEREGGWTQRSSEECRQCTSVQLLHDLRLIVRPRYNARLSFTSWRYGGQCSQQRGLHSDLR